MTMLDVPGQTGLGGSRSSKNEDKGLFFIHGQIPILDGNGIVSEFIDLPTGRTSDPNLDPWNSQTKIALKISKTST